MKKLTSEISVLRRDGSYTKAMKLTESEESNPIKGRIVSNI